MGNVTTVGIDLAKNSFSVHGVDAAGAVVLKKTVSRARLIVLLMEQQPPCLIGLEACSGAHEWARRLQQFQVRPTLANPVELLCGKRRLTIEERACGLHPGPSSRQLNKDRLETRSLSFLAPIEQRK